MKSLGLQTDDCARHFIRRYHLREMAAGRSTERIGDKWRAVNAYASERILCVQFPHALRYRCLVTYLRRPDWWQQSKRILENVGAPTV